MRFIKLAVMLGGIAALHLPQLTASSPFFEDPPVLNFYVAGGFREDFLKFHIGGDKPHPKVFSKVEWKNLKIAEISASVNYSTCNNYYMRANGGYGRIIQGDGSVSNEFTIHQQKEEIDHHQPQKPQRHGHRKKGRQSQTQEITFDNIDQHHQHHRHGHHEFSKQKADAGFGYVCDFSGGFGWKMISGAGRGWIAGIIGYSFDRQNLKMRHFEQKKDSRGLFKDICLDGLRGNYLTRWIGPWIGLDFSAQVECEVTAFGTAEWHNVDYRGNGRWRTQDFSAKIHHHARGYGVVGTLGFDWRPSDHWGFGLLGEYQQWSTKKGHNRSKVDCQLLESSHIASTFPVAQRSKLFRVKWISFSISAVVAYQY